LSSKLWAETPKSRKIAEEIKRIRALLNIIIVWLRRQVARFVMRHFEFSV